MAIVFWPRLDLQLRLGHPKCLRRRVEPCPGTLRAIGGKCRGFGFVTYGTVEEATKASSFRDMGGGLRLKGPEERRR